MATKTNWDFDGLKKEFHRTKQKLKSKMGKAPQTVDVTFNQERQRFEEKHKLMKRLVSSIERYEKAIRELSIAQGQLSETIATLYEPQCELYNACMINQNVTCEIDAYRIELEENIRTHVKGPMNDHLSQYTIVQQRIEERGRRRIDMDRYRADYDRAIKRGEVEPKLSMYKEKADRMTSAYNEINMELLTDFPKLLDDRFFFFDPLFCTIIDSQVSFFKRCSESAEQLVPFTEKVDRLGYLDHTTVITPPEESCYAKPISQATGPTTIVAALPALAGRSSSLALPAPDSANTPAAATIDEAAAPVSPKASQTEFQGTCTGLYKFEAADDTELSFEAGDVINIIAKHGDWWEGELNGNKGLFPSAYVKDNAQPESMLD